MGDNDTSTGMPEASLLGIPAEIRELIFEHLFSDAALKADEIFVNEPPFRAVRFYPSGWYEPAILQSCTQLHREASKALLSSMTLACSDVQMSLLVPAVTARPLLQKLPHLKLKDLDWQSDKRLRHELDQVLEGFPKLQILEISLDSYDWQLPRTEDKKIAEEQLEGACDERLKQAWSEKLLQYYSCLDDIVQSDHLPFNVWQTVHAFVNGPWRDQSRTKNSQTLELTFDVRTKRTIAREVFDKVNGRMESWHDGLIRTYQLPVEIQLNGARRLLETAVWKRDR